VTFGRPTKRLGGLVPGRALWTSLSQGLCLELAWSGQPLWLYRP
jgi:protease-4